MNFLVDANLSPHVAARLTSAGHESRHVDVCALAEARDVEILVYAVEHGLVVLTADTDFGTLLAATSASSPSVVRLRSQDHLTPDQQVDQLLARGVKASSYSVRHAVAEVHDTRAECAAVEEFQVRAAFSTREERRAAAYQHGVDSQPVLVDEI